MDTNAVIDLIDGTLPTDAAKWLDKAMGRQAPCISVITRIELFSKAVDPATTTQLTGFVRFADVIGLDEPIIQQTMRLRQQRRLKLPDAIIAATALVRGLTLITRNVSDFKGIPGLAVLNPHEADQLPVL